MRKLIALSCAATAVVFAGCATDAKSPFAIDNKADAPKAPVAAPVTESVETPAPAVSYQAPAGEAANVAIDAAAPVLVEVRNAQFIVNGTTVAWEDFPATMNKLGSENPGKPVTLQLEDGFNVRVVSYVFGTCKKAGLGPVKAK